MRARLILRIAVVFIIGAASLGSTIAMAQESPSGLTVVGYGQASAPAESATLQFAVSEESFGGPPLAPAPGTTPGAREREIVAPVVAALADAGVPEASIEVIVGPYIGDVYGYGGPATALFRVHVDGLDPQGITDLVDTASLGAAEERLLIGGIGVTYEVEDCAPLQRAAREAAIADAMEQAEVQAELLDVEVGDLLASRDVPSSIDTTYAFYGSFLAGGGCAPVELADAAPGQFGATTFDPSAPAEVTVYAQVELTFSMSGADAATPES